MIFNCSIIWPPQSRAESANSQCLKVILQQFSHTTLIQHGESIAVYCDEFDAVLNIFKTSDWQRSYFYDMIFRSAKIFVVKFFVGDEITFFFPANSLQQFSIMHLYLQRSSLGSTRKKYSHTLFCKNSAAFF